MVAGWSGCSARSGVSENWQPLQIIAEQNSIGQPIIEQLQRDGLTIQPFLTSHASKAQAIESLALAFERSDIQILNDPVLVSELVAYQAESLPSGQLRYGAPSGQHDDAVMALAMAWNGRFRAAVPRVSDPRIQAGRSRFPNPATLAESICRGRQVEQNRSDLGGT